MEDTCKERKPMSCGLGEASASKSMLVRAIRRDVHLQLPERESRTVCLLRPRSVGASLPTTESEMGQRRMPFPEKRLQERVYEAAVPRTRTG